MGFLTPALLGGAALVAVPILLHLAMRRKPQEVVFPALRFVQQRREANRRRIRFRHLLLLAMRCLLILFVAAALARPALRGEGLRGKEGAPLAVALVFDNSLRMDYVRQNKTRLEESLDAARRLVNKLPEDAAVAICELGRGAGGFAPDLSTAEARLTSLDSAADSLPLAEVVADAIELAKEREDYRQEVIVFSDFTASAYSTGAMDEIRAALDESSDVRIYFVDVGVDDPQHIYLSEARLSRGPLREGQPAGVEVEVRASDARTSAIVELFLQGVGAEPEKRDERLISLDESGRGAATFQIADLPLGVHQGLVKLQTADPLTFDNTRFFTVEVRPSAHILLLAESPRNASMVRIALESMGQSFHCTTKSFVEVKSIDWNRFDAALLLDPPPLDPEAWDAVAEFASNGAGVGILLGHNASSKSFNQEAPQKLLPGLLRPIWREPTYLRPKRLDHPALSGLRDVSEGINWQLCEVWSYWQLDLQEDRSYVVAEYADGRPAIVETTLGRGRVLTTTTPFSDPAEPEGRDAWNALPHVYWPFVGICDQIVSYLAQDREHRLNYEVGQTAMVPLGPRQRLTNYVLRLPDGQAYPRVASGEDVLSLSTTEALGNYRVTAGGGKVDRGFSVNAGENMSDLTRVAPADLIAALPEDRTKLAETLEDVERLIDVGRAGRELYGWALMLVAIVWGAEHVLSNRFYRQAK